MSLWLVWATLFPQILEFFFYNFIENIFYVFGMGFLSFYSPNLEICFLHGVPKTLLIPFLRCLKLIFDLDWMIFFPDLPALIFKRPRAWSVTNASAKLFIPKSSFPASFQLGFSSVLLFIESYFHILKLFSCFTQLFVCVPLEFIQGFVPLSSLWIYVWLFIWVLCL